MQRDERLRHVRLADRAADAAGERAVRPEGRRDDQRITMMSGSFASVPRAYEKPPWTLPPVIPVNWTEPWRVVTVPVMLPCPPAGAGVNEVIVIEKWRSAWNWPVAGFNSCAVRRMSRGSRSLGGGGDHHRPDDYDDDEDQVTWERPPRSYGCACRSTGAGEWGVGPMATPPAADTGGSSTVAVGVRVRARRRTTRSSRRRTCSRAPGPRSPVRRRRT